MHILFRRRRGLAAIACLLALLSGYLPAYADPMSADDAQTQHVVDLFNSTTCDPKAKPQAQSSDPDAQTHDLVAQVTPTPYATPTPFGAIATPTPFSFGATPTPAPTPTFLPATNAGAQLFSTARPSGAPGSTPPPIPTPTPNPYASLGPVFLQRSGDTPPPITPAGQAPPTASPEPSGVPTLAPNYIAVLADKIVGNTHQGQPGDAMGNVHIYYDQEEIVGDDAHFDGIRTLTITGHPYIINHAHDSVLSGDKIIFDTIDQTAKLTNGKGTSSQGVNVGLVHFSSKDLHTEANGDGHGLHPFLTTCEKSRGGYHITGRNMDVYPGDKIVIYDAILWLGAAAIFWLPKVVIPLRSVDNPDSKPRLFPLVGYDQSEGYWIKTQTPFGRTQYYYGYYSVEYYTKVGLGLGYVGYFVKKSGHRMASANITRQVDHRVGTITYNVALTETENFSRTLRGNFGYTFQSDYGLYDNVPPTEGFNGTVVHQTARTSQNYTFTRSEVEGQSSSNSIAFTDQRQLWKDFTQALSINFNDSSTNYNGLAQSSNTAHFNSLTNYTTPGGAYQMTIDKSFSQEAFTGIDKLPEFQFRPTSFFEHFIFPIAAQFTAGEYSEPSNHFANTRFNGAVVLGPALANVFGSAFQSTVNIQQDYYGTGDLKASIQQAMSFTTPIGKHIVNQITYNEANYNGPATEPFQYLDAQSTTNTKNAQDLVRFYNGDTYNAAFGYSTDFSGQAQAISYQLTDRPSPRSVVIIGGSFNPSSDRDGNDFTTTNVQIAMPFGHDASLQFIGDVDWKNHTRIENKVAYYTKTIGNCYQLQLLYNQSQKLVTAAINVLAFPEHGYTFAVGEGGTVVPSSLNF